MKQRKRWGLIALLAWGLAVAATQMSPQQPSQEAAPPPPSPKEIPPEATQRRNPIPATAESVAFGKRLYTSQCLMCHGQAGNGKGDLAEEMNLKMPDFTDAKRMKERTDGALFIYAHRRPRRSPHARPGPPPAGRAALAFGELHPLPRQARRKSPGQAPFV